MKCLETRGLVLVLGGRGRGGCRGVIARHLHEERWVADQEVKLMRAYGLIALCS